MIKFITLSNTGYADYTLNCLKSLQKIGFNSKELCCYVIGEEGYQRIKSKGYSCVLLDSSASEDTKFTVYRREGWTDIVKRKFDIIYSNLLKYPYVCYTDGDIVFLKKDFLDWCLKHIENNELLIQNDTLDNNCKFNLCSGFMFIKSTNNTKNIFNPITVKKFIRNKWGDQTYINQMKGKMKFKMLPLRLFPNGRFYYSKSSQLNPKMIHFNWVQGHHKKKRMIAYNKWFL